MSLVPIAIGHCGISLNSMLCQYSVDYVNNLNQKLVSDSDQSNLEVNTFCDSIKRLYFNDKDLLDATTLTSRSITIDTKSDRFSQFNDNKSCEHLFDNSNESKGSNEPKNSKFKLSWKNEPNSSIVLSEPTYDIFSSNYYQSRDEKEEIENKLMKQIENTDSVNGILSLAGLGGGTGSGISSLVSTIIADNLDRTKYLSAGVLPFSYGVSTTQSINTILAMSSIYDKCDGMILLPNDDYETYLNLSLDNWTKDLNTLSKAYAMNIFHAIRPISSTCSITNRPRYTKSFEYIIDGLCSFPSLKLLDVKLLTKNSKVVSSDNKIHEQMIQQLIDNINNENRSPSSTTEKVPFSTKELNRDKSNKNLNEIYLFQDFERFKNTVRTSDSNSFNQLNVIPISSPRLNDTIVKDVGILTKGSKLTQEILSTKNKKGIRLIKTIDTKRKNTTRNNIVIGCQLNIGGSLTENLNLSNLYKSVMFWKNSARPLQVSYSKYDKGINGKTISNIMNSQSQIEKIDNLLISAIMAYNKNAYMYKYNQYGIEKDDIKESIINVENIIENYKKID